jgi:hypothetical protein
LVGVDTSPDGTVQISTATGGHFAGEQFILWWNRGAEGGGIESLAFFLNPIYERPTGNNVQVIDGHFTAVVDSDDISTDISTSPLIDTLDFEGTVAIAEPGYTDIGYTALVVPPKSITSILGRTPGCRESSALEIRSTPIRRGRFTVRVCCM